MYMEKLDKTLNCYKETLISVKNKNHTYFFVLQNDKNRIDGIYVIDEFENKYISNKFLEVIEENPAIAKEFDISGNIADESYDYKFFDVVSSSRERLKQMNFNKLNTKNSSAVIQIINSNFRSGTTRKFITNSKQERINIQLDCEAVKAEEFNQMSQENQTEQLNKIPIVIASDGAVVPYFNNKK